MIEREKSIEGFLTKEVKKRGGRAYKWVSPGNRGVPDRIVFLYAKTYFVELKSSVGVLSAVQNIQHTELKRLGIAPLVFDSRERICTWLEARDREHRLTTDIGGGVDWLARECEA